MEIGDKVKVIDAGDGWLADEGIEETIGQTVTIIKEETWGVFDWRIEMENGDAWSVRSKDLQPITAEGVEEVTAYLFNGRLYKTREKADAAQRRSVAKALKDKGYNLRALAADGDLIKAYLG